MSPLKHEMLSMKESAAKMEGFLTGYRYGITVAQMDAQYNALLKEIEDLQEIFTGVRRIAEARKGRDHG